MTVRAGWGRADLLILARQPDPPPRGEPPARFVRPRQPFVNLCMTASRMVAKGIATRLFAAADSHHRIQLDPAS
jgi:hypothetical protein